MQVPSAKTDVKTEGCGITFTVHIALVGNGSSEAFAQRVRDAISHYWNNNFTCGECKCRAKVDADVVSMPGGSCMTVNPSYHCVNVVETTTWLRSNVEMYPWENSEMASGVGNWDTLDGENIIAHETGHYLGNPDEYEDNYAYYVKDASGARISGPHYVPKSEWSGARKAQIEATAPAGGNIEFIFKAEGSLQPFSKPKPGAENDSLMADSTNASHVIKQYHFDRMCANSSASCGNECCCGNGKNEPAKGEECDSAANPNGCAHLFICTPKCQCAIPLAVCGNGKIEIQQGEKCDVNATTSTKGCAEGETCTQNCSCIPVAVDNSSATNRTNATCNESWKCGEWIAVGNPVCPPDGKQNITLRRPCTDSNKCGTNLSKPNDTMNQVRDCQFAFPRITPIVDGTPAVKFTVGKSKKIDLEINGDGRKLYLPIRVKPAGIFDKGSNYIFYNDPDLPQKLKDEITTSTGDYVKVNCGTETKCAVTVDWVEKVPIESMPSPGTATFSGFDLFWNDREYTGPTWTIEIGGKGCAESWSCNEWGACAGGTQARTCTDANSCGTTNSRPELSRSCSCTESWSCGEWGAWGDWSACAESGSQTRTRARSCTDSNSCGTTSTKPEITQTESQSCTYTPTHQKEAYTAHESSLGSRISNLDYNGATETRDLSASGGTYGYRILGIPSHVTITVCVSGSGPLSLFYYPQYPYGFDFTDTLPGCTDIYNKNNWADGVLLHLGDPDPANVNAHITVAKK